eukprot:3336350-Lingulodinium_polyedra.AAC.1
MPMSSASASQVHWPSGAPSSKPKRRASDSVRSSVNQPATEPLTTTRPPTPHGEASVAISRRARASL